MNKDNVIAIDGPAASGKSSIAALLADRLGIPYVNTGNMYRALTLAAIRNGFAENDRNPSAVLSLLKEIKIDYNKDKNGCLQLKLNGEIVDTEIRTPEVSKLVSTVAALPEVREWLVARQRLFAEMGLIVMEGRDIGTVVFPNAKYKFFLTASPRVRAERRLAQSGETAENATIDSVAAEIAKRDEMDMKRKVAPLRQADDAIPVDSSSMSIDEVLEFIISRIEL